MDLSIKVIHQWVLNKSTTEVKNPQVQIDWKTKKLLICFRQVKIAVKRWAIYGHRICIPLFTRGKLTWLPQRHHFTT